MDPVARSRELLEIAQEIAAMLDDSASTRLFEHMETLASFRFTIGRSEGDKFVASYEFGTNPVAAYAGVGDTVEKALRLICEDMQLLPAGV